MKEAEDWRSRITVDPEILAGKPVVKGTRIAVEHIVELARAAIPEPESARAARLITARGNNAQR
ncbi:MAG: DUF433 domain-containing protein [Thermofilaceae archaeon]|jgi:uncharacterized protein (DUF433 family)